MKMLPSTPGLPAVVRISRRKTGVAIAFLAAVIGVAAAWYANWAAFFGLLALMLPLAAVTYRGVSNDSNVSVARGYVFVYPMVMGTGGLELWFESTCKPRAIKEKGDAVLVSSRWSELKIVFENESLKAGFVSEVSGLLRP